MIASLSKRILRFLTVNQVIGTQEDEQRYYQYGIEITISSGINIALILFLGVLSGAFFESMVFLVTFIPIRQVSGGYHANTYLKCNVIFGMVFILVIACYRFINVFELYKIIKPFHQIVFSVVCSLIFIDVCPVENINKPISPSKNKYYKKLAALLGLCCGITAALLTVLKYKIGNMILLTLLSIIVLAVIAVIPKKGGI
ncbi:MAG: accessory gene regulator B family protein [Oscillospiraceae bacterium]|nr:accessory gene regulator B family protein [Oscillospiraceae bacterium]MBR6835664.1 accessory gene regulator B family protein [Oscillospiraceae bacterium]